MKPPKGLLFVRDRRKGDRRRKVDPRYRDPHYPEFVERRRGRERRCEDDCQFFLYNPETASKRRTIAILGALAAGVWVYLFILAVANLRHWVF